MEYSEFVDFLRSTVPAHVDVQTGEDDMIRAVDHTEHAEAYVKYSSGLDFSLQGVRHGEKGPTKIFSFKNEQEMICVLGPKGLELLDNQRRV